jgi:hypothetical protein
LILGFLSALPQDVARPFNMNRRDAFILNNDRFVPSDNWAAVFCKREDPRQCASAMISLAESKGAQEQLANGQMVPMLVYMSRPGYGLYMLVKGLDVKEGEISNVLAQRLPIGDEPVSLTLGTETYEFRLDGLNLIIEERGKTSGKQTLPLFIDDNRCIVPDPLRRNVELVWMGDLDGDQRADFLVSASAYRSCVRVALSEDPEQFLILSSRGEKGEIGKAVQFVGQRN